jgi:predicted amidohydrolase YtcJ
VVLGFLKIIKPDISFRIKGTYEVLKKAHSLGLTAAREIVNYQTVKVYHELDKKDELKLRIFGYITIYDLDEYLREFPKGKLYGNNFNVIGVKILLDGSLGARTAALKEPYSNEPKNLGKLLYSDEELKEIFNRVKELNMSLMAHTIGDRALQQFIDIYQTVFEDQIPNNPLGHSVEHVEVIDDKLLGELKRIGICVSAQPNFAGRWSVPGGLNETTLGELRLQKCNAYRSFIENKIQLVFGSDCMPLDPIFGINSAIFHPIQNQRIPPEVVIKAYTYGCYKLLNLESKFGTLEPGKLADLVILSRNPIVTPESEFVDIKVSGTIFSGEVVYSDGLKFL